MVPDRPDFSSGLCHISATSSAYVGGKRLELIPYGLRNEPSTGLHTDFQSDQVNTCYQGSRFLVAQSHDFRHRVD